MIKRLAVHAAVALSIMLAASIAGAILLPADAQFLMHTSGRTGGRLEGLVVLPVLALLAACALALRLRLGSRPPREWPLQLALVHILAFLHLNVVVTGFQMSATGHWDGWIAAASVAAVGLLTVLAAVRALGVVEGDREREEPRL